MNSPQPTINSGGYNPEFNPTGIEGGVDTNSLPWCPVPGVNGMSIKPMRASAETGMFSVIVRLEAGTRIPETVYLGGMDMLLLSGEVIYEQANTSSTLEPGTWGYISANSRVASMAATVASEFLANYHNAVAFLDGSGAVDSVFTSMDVLRMARDHKLTLVPNTLADCMQDRPPAFDGNAQPLEISTRDASRLVVSDRETASAKVRHPHFVDTRGVPWVVNDNMPDIGLKVLRISEETGYVSLIVRHNGVATPHNHLAASDFLILHGHLGYRAGPPEGYGPGVWIFEPAGARHEATQRVGNDDLIYTANLYGPIAFDSGKGTPIVYVLSWIEYKALAEAGGARLVRCENPDDSTLLAWAPLRG